MAVAEYFLETWEAVTWEPLVQRQDQAVLSDKDTDLIQIGYMQRYLYTIHKNNYAIQKTLDWFFF